MTIRPYGTAALAAWRASDHFAALRGDFGTLQNQLSSGKVASTHAGLSGGASASLTIRSRLTALDGFAANIQDGTLRVNAMSAGLTEIVKLGGSLPPTLTGAIGQVAVGATSAAVSALNGVQMIVDVLNTEVGGRYLFSGRATDKRPLVSPSLMIDGDGTRAGLKTLIAERKAADLGTGGMGRLTLSTAATTVTLAEEAAGLPFGIKLAGASATGTGVTASMLAGPPAAAEIAVPAQPASGDTISLVVRLPDGTEKTVKLVAGGGAKSGEVDFAIGATEADTAANIATALNGAIASLAAAELPASSAMKAANDFFAADSANPPMRVAGPPYATATALVPGTAQNTVVWYAGDTSSSPRETAPVRIADNRTVGIGAQANEPAIRAVLASFAVLAAEAFPEADPNSKPRYLALGELISAQLRSENGTQKVSEIVTDLSIAGATMKTARGDLRIAKGQTEDALADVESADPNEVAMRLMATQTRLQAAYQTTSALQRLSLVNYL